MTEPRGTGRSIRKTDELEKRPAGSAVPLRITHASYVLPAGARGSVRATAAEPSGAHASAPLPSIGISFAPGLASTAARDRSTSAAPPPRRRSRARERRRPGGGRDGRRPRRRCGSGSRSGARRVPAPGCDASARAAARGRRRRTRGQRQPRAGRPGPRGSARRGEVRLELALLAASSASKAYGATLTWGSAAI